MDQGPQSWHIEWVFDAHFYVLDPKYPLFENAGYLPEPFTISDYRSRVNGFGITGGAVIGSSFQGYNQAFMCDTLTTLGEGWVGVTQLPPDASDADILELDGKGVRAVRFNLKRGETDVTRLTFQAVQAYELAGWHAELYVDSSMLMSLEPIIGKLPAVSIDHLGMSESSLPYLLELVDRGVHVKAAGFGRVDLDIVDALTRIHRVNPEALMFGTDLPGTRSTRSFEAHDIQIIEEAVGDDLHAVLSDNARAWYRIQD